MAGVTRRLVLWCPDWPVLAASAEAGLLPRTPAAVFRVNRVLACSATARSRGVHRGQRRRPAQETCPELVVFADDPRRDTRAFEPVAAAVEAAVPGVEVVRPGLVAVPARGPANYFGGEKAAAERLVDRVEADTGVECQVGVADGLFTATLAARRGVIVPPGRSEEFLAPLGIAELDQPGRGETEHADLVELLHRLGVRTLGRFAQLPEREVATRFGTVGVEAHRLARGQEERPPVRRQPPAELAVTETLEPPVERVDVAAFAGKTLAERLHALLERNGLACVRLGITTRTDSGEELHRAWRCSEPLTPAGTADRVRWQLDGWLNHGEGANRPTAGVAVLTLISEEVVEAGGLQRDLTDPALGDATERAGRALVRVQGLLGPRAVLTGELGGGRSPVDRELWTPWGDEHRTRLARDRPWPGRLPVPSPSVLPRQPPPAEVLDDGAVPVSITERNSITAEPHQVAVRGCAGRRVLSWAGPWPVRERWWAGGGSRRSPITEGPAPGRDVVRLQVVLEPESEAGEDALLLGYSSGCWYVEGWYS